MKKEKQIIDPIKLEQEIASRYAVTGNFAEWFNILPDPDPILRKLGTDIVVYKDLLADDQVGSTTIRLKNEVKALEWQLMPSENGTENDKEYKLCKTALDYLMNNGFAIKDIISQSLNPHFWGMVVFEIIWKEVNKVWLPHKIYAKPIEWFKFDTDNELRFHPQIGAEEGIPITGEKADPTLKYRFIILRNEPDYENPYGIKALSRCFWPVTFKRGGLKFFATFVEKYGMPHVTIKHPPGYTEEEVNSLVTKASAMIQDAVAAVPDGNQVEINRAGEKSSADIYKMYIDMMNASIEKAILTNTLSTEQQSKGGYSSASAGSDIVESLGKELKNYPEEFFNKLLKLIVELNIGSDINPTFGTFEEDEPNKEFAERDKLLSEIGVRYTKNYFSRKYNLKEDEFEIGEPNKPTDPNNPTPPAQFSETDKTKLFAEELTDQLPNKLLQAQIEKTLKPVIDMINNSVSFSEVEDKLVELYPKMNSKGIENLLAKLIFITEIEGRKSVG